VREKIEVAGQESRWEFSKTALFERTSYISEVCNELLHMLDTVHSLRQFLGPQLEAVMGNSQVQEHVALHPVQCEMLLCLQIFKTCCTGENFHLPLLPLACTGIWMHSICLLLP